MRKETINNVNTRYKRNLNLIFNKSGIAGNLEGVRRGARSLTYILRLKDPFYLERSRKITENVALACRSRNVLIMRYAGLIHYQIELPERHWLSYVRGKDVKGLSVGLTDEKTPVDYAFEPAHSLIAGTTGSGKTYTTMSILLGLIESYTPEELEVVICDPHSDLEVFDNEEHVTRFEWGCIATTMGEINDAIGYAHQLLMQRIRHRVKDGKKVVVVVDEAEAIVASDSDVLRMLVDIGNQARKYNIHLIATSKKPTQKNLPDLLNTLSNRWVGKTSMDKGTITRLLGQSIDVNALTAQGDFVHVDNNSTVRFLVARIQDKDFDTLTRIERGVVRLQNEREVTMPVDTEVRDKPFFIGSNRVEFDPEVFAYYVSERNGVSIAQAKNTFGFGRTIHNHYKAAVKKFGRELWAIDNDLARGMLSD